MPGYYHQQNAGKRNISIDLRAPGARELVLALVRHADVLIENYRPDVMPRLGLGYDALRAVNPRLIMLSISGFGQGGPESHAAGLRADRPRRDRADGARASAAAAGCRGATCRCRWPTPTPRCTAWSACSSALIMRERTGVGQHVDIAMVDATVATDDQLQYDLEGSEASAPLPNDTWETGAGPILVSADFRYLWRLLTTQAGRARARHRRRRPGDQDRARGARRSADFMRA